MAKTFSIERYAYGRMTERYYAEFSEDEINDYIDGINTRVVGEVKIPHLTLDQVRDIWEENDASDKFYEMKVELRCHSRTFPDIKSTSESVGSIIRDYLNDCVWDAYVDIEDSEIDDWEDETSIYGED